MHKECGTSRGSKLVRIGDLCMGLISHLHWPTTFSISAPIHHHGDIPLPPCMCSMGFCPHIPGSHPCLRFHPHQSGVSSPPEVSSSPSMVHDHTFTAAWRVVGGCCFYEGKGPLVRSLGGALEYTRNPESPPLQIDIPIFLFTSD